MEFWWVLKKEIKSIKPTLPNSHSFPCTFKTFNSLEDFRQAFSHFLDQASRVKPPTAKTNPSIPAKIPPILTLTTNMNTRHLLWHPSSIPIYFPCSLFSPSELTIYHQIYTNYGKQFEYPCSMFNSLYVLADDEKIYIYHSG